MFTSSAAQRTRTSPPDIGAEGSGVIVQLEIPGRGQQPESVAGQRPALDPLELARAVRGLIHAIAPDLPAEVRVEFGSPSPEPAPVSPSASAPEGRPAVRAVPAAPLDRFDDEPADDGQPGNDLHLDLLSRTLTVDGEVVVLTRREFDLLAYLRNRRGAAVTRRELMSGVWQTGYLSGDRTIDVHIRRLRMKLGSHAGRLATLRGYGYRLD